MKKYHISSEVSGAPLSGAVEANGFVYVSGQIHADQDWNVIGTSIEEKFEITMGRIENILAEAGLTKDNIIRVHIYMTDLRELPQLNTRYTEYFTHQIGRAHV